MDIDAVMASQAGVISRGQVLGLGFDDDFIESRIRHRLWARVHRGVYVDHTGPLSPEQRRWAAVLFYGHAALCDETALEALGLRPATGDGVVHVAVDRSRRVEEIAGVRLHRLVDLPGQVHPARRPPTVRLEHAVLQVASRRRGTVDCIAVLADACGSRRTTAARLAGVLTRLPCLPGRADLLALLQDVAAGTCSVLEHRYLTRVERPHGLPRAGRQRRKHRSGRAVYQDVDYLGGRLVVELDGAWATTTPRVNGRISSGTSIPRSTARSRSASGGSTSSTRVGSPSSSYDS